MRKQRRRRVDQLVQIKDPQKVKVLILTQQKASIKDFFFIRNFTQIKKMDLSYNKLASFPIGFSFRNFTQLRILYLHYNKFNNLKSIQPLSECRCLQYLTMFGNSLQQTKTRHMMINQIPSLKLMDDKIVKIQQRAFELFDQRTSIVKLSFPIVTIVLSDQSSAFLSVVIQQLYLIRKYYLKCNPIVRIQRYWRMKLKKNKNYHKKIKIVLEKDLLYPMNSQQIINRPMTKKLQIHKSKEQKVVSIFTMNLQFWNSVRKMTQKKKVFALKNYCQQNKLPFITFKQFLYKNNFGYIGMKIPYENSNKSFLPFFIQTSFMFMIRRINKKGYEKSNNNNLLFLNNLQIKPNKKDKMYKLSEQQDKKVSHNLHKISKLQENYFSNIVILDLPSDKIFQKIKKLYQNRKSSTIFPFCFEDIIQRSISAISIQRLWRGYKIRKQKTMRQMILQNRSALKIQKWIRNLSFIHRNKFLIYVRDYLSKQDSKSIIISSKVIKQFEQNKKRIEKYKNLLIPFQKDNFFVYKQMIEEQQKNTIVFKADRSPYPQYFENIVSFQTKIKKYHDESQSQSTIQDILFKNCQKVEYLNDKRPLSLKQSYIEFHYNTIQEARNRKFILALKSYNMKNHYFLKSLNIQNKKAGMIFQQKCLNQIIKQNFIVASNAIILPIKCQLLNWKKIKIRYYNGKDDHSCLIKIASMNPSLGTLNPIKGIKKLQTQRLKIQTKITRSYLALQQLSQRQVSPKSYRYYQQDQRFKDLFTDNSKTTILNLNLNQNINLNLDNSKKILHHYTNSNNYNQQTFRIHNTSQQTLGVKSIVQSIQQDLQNKKSRIKQIKQSHIQKLATVSVNKQQRLKKLRQSVAVIHQTNNKILQQKRTNDYIQKIKRYNKVRNNLLNKSQASFENQFSARGNRSMRIQLLRFQRQMHDFKSGKNTVRNYDYNINQSSPLNASNITNKLNKTKVLQSIKGKKRSNNSIKKSVTTQIRQFSIAQSNPDGGPFNRLQSIHMIQQKQKQKRQEKRQQRKMSQKIKNESIKQQQNHKQLQQIQNPRKAGTNSRNSNSSKNKKMIHSVFPQEYYPLQEGRRLGFQLPKLKFKK